MVVQAVAVHLQITYRLPEVRREQSRLAPSDHDVLKLFLARHGLLSCEFVYRGFDKSRLRLVLTTGTDRDESSERHHEKLTSRLRPQDYLCATPIQDSGMYVRLTNYFFCGREVSDSERDSLEALCSGNLDWAVNEAFFSGRNALAIYQLKMLHRVGRGNTVYIAKKTFLDAIVKVVVPVAAAVADP